MRLRTRFIANLVGVGWTAVLQLAFVPIYVGALGVEAYGLVGLYLALISIAQLVELGLGPTINREMARAAVVGNLTRQRNALRTLEVLYGLVAIALGLSLYLSAAIIADRWINPAVLSRATVQQAIQLMALLLMFQWPQALYQSALIGLQRQVAANVLKVGFATASATGGTLVLYTISPTITAFLVWQAALAGIQLICTAIVAWRSLLARPEIPVFDRAWLREISGFVLGMSGITAAGVVLTQLDKVVLSHVLALRDFGIYTLAGVLGIGVGVIANAIFLVTYPKYTELVARGDTAGLLDLYRLAAQACAALGMATAAVVAGFSYEILLLWTRNEEVARAAAPITSLLAIGTAMNGTWKHAYSLQLAYGWTTLALRLSWLMVIFAVPLLVVAATEFGGVGAAAVWLCLNATLMIIGIYLTHRSLLTTARSVWLGDLARPMVAATAAVLCVRLLIAVNGHTENLLPALAGAMVLSLAASIAAAPLARSWVGARLQRSTR